MNKLAFLGFIFLASCTDSGGEREIRDRISVTDTVKKTPLSEVKTDSVKVFVTN